MISLGPASKSLLAGSITRLRKPRFSSRERLRARTYNRELADFRGRPRKMDRNAGGGGEIN